MDKKTVLDVINGYKTANEFIELERIKRLQKIIPSESLKMFMDLCQIVNLIPENKSDELEQLKVAYLIKRRNALNKLAKKI